MNFWQTLTEAFDSLITNKLRSLLTILGIVIGVGAVIAMLAIGTGAESSITGEIQGIGTNLLFVFRGGSEEVRNPKPLTLGDAKALADPFNAPSIENIAAVLQGNTEASFAGEKSISQLIGVTPAYESVRNVQLAEGEFISEEHVFGRSAVVILGSEVADSLFGRKSGLVGETVRIEGQPFRIIGLIEEKGGSSPMTSEDNVLIVPMSTAQSRLLKRTPNDAVDTIYVQAISSELVPVAADEVAQVLRSRHRTDIGADDFSILSQQDFLDVASSITGILTIFLGGIAGISLLVGGIGIMNIMLVSVMERTKEIGLRKAMGARKSDILFQFLAESSLLSLLGGFIGILLGWGLTEIVARIAAASNADFTPIIESNAIILATVFSAMVGLFFGMYPANRAASLEPVEALRYE